MYYYYLFFYFSGSSCNECQCPKSTCLLKLNLLDVPLRITNILQVSYNIGFASEQELQQLEQGYSISLPSKGGVIYNPSSRIPLIELEFDCSKFIVIQSISIIVADPQCPSGKRIYYLNWPLLSRAKANCDCEIELDLYLDGDFSDFYSYCIN